MRVEETEGIEDKIGSNISFPTQRSDPMVHASKKPVKEPAEGLAQTAEAIRPPRRTRVQAAWDRPGLIDLPQKHPAILRQCDLHAAKLEDAGKIPSAVISLDQQREDGSTPGILSGISAPVDIESDAVESDFSDKFRELVEHLESKHPPCGRVLLWRMEDVKLEEIGRKLAGEFGRGPTGVTRERVRQIDAKARKLMREDPEIRALAKSAGIDIDAYARHIAFLNELGFSEAFISRWEKYGFPSSDHLTIAAVFIAEAAYPFCVPADVPVQLEPGKDRLDKVRFAKILVKINPGKINDLCDEFGKDMGELIDRLQAYFAKCVERANACLDLPKPEIQTEAEKPKAEVAV